MLKLSVVTEARGPVGYALDGRYVARVEVFLDVFFPDSECSADPDGRKLATADQAVDGHLRNPHALSDL
jgi:hypothetical protein